MRSSVLMKSLVSMLLLVSGSAFAVSDFDLPWKNRGSLDPQTWNSASYKNTVYVVEVYQLRCPPCNTNAANVNSLAAEFKSNSKVQVVSVGLDQDDNSYVSWISRHNPNHPVLMDAGRSLSRQLGVASTPTAYILDCNKNVKWQHSGVWSAETVNTIRSTISSLSQQRCE